MVRSGELPSRLLALHYGADLVWGPETVDHSLIGATRRVNPRTGMIEYTRQPSHAYSPANSAARNNSNSNDNDNNEAAAAESVIYRLDPEREKGKLVFQLGTSDAERAVAAARVVAADVAGIDVNAGCPKPFSVLGGMGAALLRAPEKLAGILEALARDITPAFGIGISVKIRLLETPAETEALVRRLVRTGITGLTVHCRTTPMRPRERAIRGQLAMIRSVCHEAGVACLMNGDVESRDHADGLVRQFGVDGAMIATAAEKNPSCFRSRADGGLAAWPEVARRYLRFAMEVENRAANTKYLLAQIIPGKAPAYRDVQRGRSYSDFARALGCDEEMRAMAREADRVLGLGEFEPRRGPKQKNKQQQKGQQSGQPSGQQQESKKRKRGQDEEEEEEREGGGGGGGGEQEAKAKDESAKRPEVAAEPAPVAAPAAIAV
ncbi:uncharacterized protein P884DRAFT_192541 [Thermothelomyces heterothallicus CBS 202.75]|uniref:uncharacterized protein n=1 Tax=Thermothelomyces heterothallicus CBS 202.75 TaxID=1149848 RepID=UPI0037434CA4